MSENKQEISEEVENSWMIRPAEVYEDEYKDCRSMASRFHQYYIYGKTLDCSQWKRDADNCYKWEKHKDLKALNELIASEKVRRAERLGMHYRNNIWEKRAEPPNDWNKPLPEYLQKEYENSYLDIKNKELKGEIKPLYDPGCTIL